ncbi:hypothetical protein [Bacillus phage phiAGATE]|uniref:Uncharacterized protein n=1 Tax=Bacillus phage phiAGATE TaxID=1204533 RepID=L0LCC8_9CAUD|nr:hypothetical protein G380_gp116 [Bacillus phage phiAGATE]AGB62766.1 hypothetical protein [Bacillus phage phiAGATE]
MGMTKLYIPADDVYKINKETGKVDCSGLPESNLVNNEELGASDKMMFPSDVAILIDASQAVDADPTKDNGDTVWLYWFEDGTEVQILSEI